ncbi:hypothetical protein EDB84DRAFT_295846 [Lactarius hengduanensis]|nr:hypothetical protein EDB84DRAFT_295846 [Lactarius hengduanensis]
MPSFLAPIIAFYDYALQPVPALAWLGAPVSALDVAAALRLAVSLRQVRKLYYDQHVAKISATGSIPEDGKKVGELTESRSRVRDLVATLVMVHGGEAISGASRVPPLSGSAYSSCSVAAPWLGLQPSFLVSGTSPTIFLSAHALVDLLPTIPSLSVRTELPLTILHALHRTILLCNVVPRVVAGHASPAVATSPYTLLLTAIIMPNGGPFFANLFSLLRPTPMQVSTPPELLPYGWTATDLWAAPLVTGLYATLTHAQPFFAHLHVLLFSFLSPLGLAYLSDASAKRDGPSTQKEVAPLDTHTARAVCAIVLCALHVNRAVRTYGRETVRKPVPVPVPSTSVGEKPLEEEITSSRRRGLAETAAARGKSDSSMPGCQLNVL